MRRRRCSGSKSEGLQSGREPERGEALPGGASTTTGASSKGIELGRMSSVYNLIPDTLLPFGGVKVEVAVCIGLADPNVVMEQKTEVRNEVVTTPDAKEMQLPEPSYFPLVGRGEEVYDRVYQAGPSL